MVENQDKIVVYDEFGNSKECNILAIINKKYIIYADTNNKRMKSNLLVSKFEKFDENINLLPLDDNEWELVEKEYKKICHNIVNQK